MTRRAEDEGAQDDAGRPLSYADAGVGLDAAERLVDVLRPHVAKTSRPEVVGDIGGFAGVFAFDPGRYRDPLLVSSSDGVGTKVELARRLDLLESVGHDVVGMVCNDLVVTGAEPLFFQDVLTVGHLDPDRAARIVSGVAEGCRIAGCALVGGEVAEHPGLLDPDEFDLVGFGVGAVERDLLLGPQLVRDGDALVALASSGLHSNGYSLVRRIVADLDLGDDHGLDRSLGEVLLTPTRIYVPDCLALVTDLEVHALCHVTGGGVPGNLRRVLPEGLGATLDAASYARPQVFDVLQFSGPVAEEEMWRTFNMGIGMLAVIAAGDAEAAVSLLDRRGVPAWIAGRVHPGDGVEITGPG